MNEDLLRAADGWRKLGNIFFEGVEFWPFGKAWIFCLHREASLSWRAIPRDQQPSVGQMMSESLGLLERMRS